MDCATACSMTSTNTGNFTNLTVLEPKNSPLSELNSNAKSSSATSSTLAQQQQPKVNANAEIESIANIVIKTLTEALRLSIRVEPELEDTDFVIHGVCNPAVNDGKPVSMPINVTKLFSLCQNGTIPSQSRFHDYSKKVTEVVSRILSEGASVAKAFVARYDVASKEKAFGSLIVRKITLEILSNFEGGAFKGTPLENYSPLQNPFAEAPGFKAALKRVLA